MRLLAAALLALAAAMPASAQQTKQPNDRGKEILANAKAGNAEAQNALGFAYQNGLSGFAKNPAEAISWLTKSAEGGVAAAENNLCHLYASSLQLLMIKDSASPLTGVTKPDVDAASKWCAKAAEHQFQASQRLYGSLLARGATDAKGATLLKADPDKAYYWLWLGRASSAERSLALVGARLTTERIAAIKTEAEEWNRKAVGPGVVPVQTCSTRASTAFADISAAIRGTVVENVVIEYGPAGGRPLAGPAEKDFKRTSFATRLYYHQVGASVPGKDWRDPGTVAFEDGGVFIYWPKILVDGNVLPEVVAEVSFGDLKYRRSIKQTGKETEPVVMMLRLDPRLPAPVMKHEVALIDEAVLPAWREAYFAEKPIQLDLFDATGKQHIVNYRFTVAKRTQIQERMIAAVNTLRLAVAEGTCSK